MLEPLTPLCSCKQCRMLYTFALAAVSVADETHLSTSAREHARYVREHYPMKSSTPTHERLSELFKRLAQASPAEIG